MKSKKGFTLIELLVVIAIIALLMAIVMPALRIAKRQARILTCTSNVRQLAMSFLLYAEDFDTKLPHKPANSVNYPHIWWYTTGGTTNPSVHDNRIFFDGYLDGFVLEKAGEWTEGVDKAPEVMYCPEVKRLNSPQFGYGRQWPTQQHAGWRPFESSYSYFNQGDMPGTWHSSSPMPRKTTDRGSLPMFGDIIEIYGSNLDIWSRSNSEFRQVNHFPRGFDEHIKPGDEWPMGMNQACLDGSAGFRKYEDCEVYWSQGALNIWARP